MRHRNIEPPVGHPGRRFPWTLRILALTAVMLGACVLSSSRPQLLSPSSSATASREQSAGAVGDELEFVPAPGSGAELQGSTSVGSWTSRSAEIHGQILLSTSEDALEALFDRIHDPVPALVLPLREAAIASISVPVASLHGDSAGMDHDMRQALKADQYPFIQYDYQCVERATVISDPASHQSKLNLRISGRLTMAGATHPITMDVLVGRDSPRHFHAKAQTTLMMSDFGVTPPVALFGLIKAGDKVHVTFELVLDD